MELFKGKKVRCGEQGPHYGEIGIVKSIHSNGINILWEGNLMESRYAWDSDTVDSLQEVGR